MSQSSQKYSWCSKRKEISDSNFHEGNFAYLHYSVAQQIWSFACEIIGTLAKEILVRILTL